MAVEITNQAPSPTVGGSPVDGLGYSRHYANRIRDFGHASKSSWIERLSVVLRDGSSKSIRRSMGNNNSELPVQRTPPTQGQRASLPHLSQKSAPPVINSNGSNTRTRFYSYSGIDRIHPLPPRLQNSPYNVPILRETQITPRNTVIGSSHNTHPGAPSPNSQNSKSTTTTNAQKSSSGKLENSSNTSNGQTKLPSIHTSHSSGSLTGRKSPQHKTSKPSPWIPLQKSNTSLHMEKKARDMADRAMRANKVFICEAPYPIDRFVRLGLRKRGWVEKFRDGITIQSPYADSAPTYRLRDRPGANSLEDEIKAVCEESVLHPLYEGGGIYSIVSRLVRHYPAKFIWGGTSVNNLPLRSETVVNHFPKAKCFSSKTGLCSSLRELPWLASNTSMHFFPRCYLLNEDDKGDFIDDYRTTACLGIIKWVLNKYRIIDEQKEFPILREASQTQIVQEGDYLIRRPLQPIVSNSEDNTQPPVSSEPNASGEQNTDISSPENSDLSTEKNENMKENIDTDNHEKDTELQNGGDVPEYWAEGENEDQVLEEESGESGGDEKENLNSITHSDDAKSSQKTDGGSKGQSTTKKSKVPKIKPQLKRRGEDSKGGEVPTKIIDLVIQQLERFLWIKEHKDLDAKIKKRGLYGAEWNKVLKWHYEIMHENATVAITEEKLSQCASLLNQMEEHWPQIEMDGMKNIWIIKPGLKSKGIGIACCKKLEDILKFVEVSNTPGTTSSSCYVVQKYIENPLLLHNCKFDLRQWFVVTEWNPLTIWFYKDCYLRICSQEFSLEDFHESIHLSNVAIQQFYENGPRSEKLPENNFMTSRSLQEHLEELGDGDAWKEKIYPGMKDAVINMLLATQDVAETRKNGFELYGADFMLTADYTPWLIEVNSSPGMSPSSREKVKLCSSVIEDTIKVVLDRRDNRDCETGGFELSFRQAPVPRPKGYDLNMKIEGKKIKKLDLSKYTELDKKNAVAEAKQAKREAAAQRAAELEAKVAELKLKKSQEEKSVTDGEKKEGDDGKNEDKIQGAKVSEVSD